MLSVFASKWINNTSRRAIKWHKKVESVQMDMFTAKKQLAYAWDICDKKSNVAKLLLATQSKMIHYVHKSYCKMAHIRLSLFCLEKDMSSALGKL